MQPLLGRGVGRSCCLEEHFVNFEAQAVDPSLIKAARNNFGGWNTAPQEARMMPPKCGVAKPLYTGRDDVLLKEAQAQG